MSEFKYNLGIAQDPRTEEEKAKDYQHSDSAGDVIAVWEEKSKDQWRHFAPREQDGSLSCCGQASAKAAEILLGAIMSAHPIYRSRSNFPDGGMYLQNVGEIWKKVGSTLETLDASQFQNESTMNRAITVATPNQMGGYKFPKAKVIEEIAEAISVHGHCLLIFHCAKSEWSEKPEFSGKPIDFGHCVCAVDYFLHEGKKVILIEDSTGHFTSIEPELIGQRMITEDFLIKRCDGAMYLTLPAPSGYVFTKTLRFGMQNDDVKQLQRVLGVIQTGYFGNLTLTALKKFQAAHGLVADGVDGPLTNVELNKLS